MIVAAVAAGCVAATAAVVANHAIAIQVVGTAAGGAMTIGGVALAASSWPRRRVSAHRQLLASAGFFIACIGVFAMVTGAGLFH